MSTLYEGDAFDDFSSSGSGTSDILTSLFSNAAQVATTAITAGSASQPPQLYNTYGQRIPGAGVYSPATSGIGNFLLVAVLAVAGVIAVKKFAS